MTSALLQAPQSAVISVQDIPTLPVIREAIEINSYTIADVLAENAWQHKRSPFVTSARRFDVPFIMFDADGGTIDWGKPDVVFSFTKRQKSYRFRIRFAASGLPGGAVEGLKGQVLSKLVELPGSDGYLIEDLLTEKNNLWVDLSLAFPLKNDLPE